jgi:hypothetical protein
MTRLDTIATRQRQARVRDAMFACFVVLAAMLGAVTVASAGWAVHTATPIAQR